MNDGLSYPREELSGGVLELDAEDLLELLPQRPSMLLVDRVVCLVPGVHAVGIKAVTGNEYGLASRRHGFVFPSTFVLEGLVQLATVTLLYASKERPLLGLHTVESMEVHQEMMAGERLYLTVNVTTAGQPVAGALSAPVRIEGEAELGGKTFVKVAFTVAPYPE